MPDRSASAPPGGAAAGTTDADLARLRRAWGSAYRITWDEGFRATHIATGGRLRAATARELEDRIRGHYGNRASAGA